MAIYIVKMKEGSDNPEQYLKEYDQLNHARYGSFEEAKRFLSKEEAIRISKITGDQTPKEYIA